MLKFKYQIFREDSDITWEPDVESSSDSDESTISESEDFVFESDRYYLCFIIYTSRLLLLCLPPSGGDI